jgi:bifunctional DNase/RNase
LVVLREHDEPHRLLPLFVGGFEATSIALALGGSLPPRPLTHDLMVTLVERLDAAIDRVELTGFEDETFLAEMVLQGPNGEQRIDARPSDAIAMAVRVDAPVFVSDEVLERAGAAPLPEEIDPAVIDQEVAAFSEFLSDVDPTDFANLELPEAPEPEPEPEPEPDQ